MISLRYEVRVQDAAAHLLEVTLVASGDLPDDLVLVMPVWTPGSYLVREHARAVEAISATSPTGPLPIRKIRKSAWRVEARGASSVTVRWVLYANDVSVRTNHVDASHAFWTGAATYLFPEGATAIDARVRPIVPEEWAIATTLPAAEDDPRSFVAGSVEALVCSPFECGPMTPRAFSAGGREHSLWVWRSGHDDAVDWARMTEDARRVAEAVIGLAGGGEPPPYPRHTAIWHVSPRSRGGLEHDDGSVLATPPGSYSTRSGWLDAVSLYAHELLHAWNVRRIRPAGLCPPRWETESYTRLLWWFEGATSYFDWRALRLAGVCTRDEWLDHLAGELSRLEDTPGAAVQSLADSSYDAWIKAYRPDESAPLSRVSYYRKGEVVCFLLDLEIRARTGGARSLDDVLRWLWRHHGSTGIPVPEDGMPHAFEQATGVDVSALLDAWVDRPGVIDPTPTLLRAGLTLERSRLAPSRRSTLGLRARPRAGRAVVDVVLRGSPAMRAGIDVGDELVAIGGRRLDDGLDTALARLPLGGEHEVVLVRDGLLHTVRVTLDAGRAEGGRLVVRGESAALAEAWLGPAT